MICFSLLSLSIARLPNWPYLIRLHAQISFHVVRPSPSASASFSTSSTSRSKAPVCGCPSMLSCSSMMSGLPGTKRMIRSVPNAGGEGDEDSAAGSAASYFAVSGVVGPVSEVGDGAGTSFATEVTPAMGAGAATGVGLPGRHPQIAAAVQQSTPAQISIQWPARNMIARLLQLA